MKNKTKILLFKVVAAVLWVFALFFPEIYAASENVEMVDFNQVKQEQSTTSTYYFDIEFTHVVVEGTVTMGFYDEYGVLKFTSEVPFEDNGSKIVSISVTSTEFASISEYKFEGAEVVSKSLNVVNTVCIPLMIVFAIVLILALRIQYQEYELDGKKVVIYAGIVHHTVHVDGVQVYGEKYFLTTKKTQMVVPVSDTKELIVVLRASNKIEAMPRNKEVVASEGADTSVQTSEPAVAETQAKEVAKDSNQAVESEVKSEETASNENKDSNKTEE